MTAYLLCVGQQMKTEIFIIRAYNFCGVKFIIWIHKSFFGDSIQIWIFCIVSNLITRVEHSVKWVGYGLDDQAIVVWFLAGERDFSLFQRVYTGSGANPAYCPLGRVRHTSRDKATGECNYLSPQSSAEFKNEWSSISTSPCLHSVHRDNFNFYLLIMVPVLLTD
jgi:hypothetical protein